jgi:hypothetical protein
MLYAVVQLCDADPDYCEVVQLEEEQMPAFIRAALTDEFLGKGVTRCAHITPEEEALIVEIVAALKSTGRWIKNGYTYRYERADRWPS